MPKGHHRKAHNQQHKIPVLNRICCYHTTNKLINVKLTLCWKCQCSYPNIASCSPVWRRGRSHVTVGRSTERKWNRLWIRKPTAESFALAQTMTVMEAAFVTSDDQCGWSELSERRQHHFLTANNWDKFNANTLNVSR